MLAIASGFANLQSALFTVAAFLFVLSVVVIFHELGHFLVARWCGVKIDAFAMGFGPEIIGWNDSKGTRWRLNWIPLGGYVKFMDDANGASDPDPAKIAAMSAEELSTSFHAKPLWQRSAVLFAGPFANFILAAAILATLFMFWGVHITPARVEALVTGGPAYRGGLRPGDLITKINGGDVAGYSDVWRAVTTSPGKPLSWPR